MILINKKDAPVYSGDHTGNILFLETKGESALMVVSLGSHPCTYITFPGIGHISDYEDANDLCPVHYGFTFLGTRKNLGIEGIWLGWDYAHYGDLLYSEHHDYRVPEDHEWTLNELKFEARVALETILQREASDDEEKRLLEP